MTPKTDNYLAFRRFNLARLAWMFYPHAPQEWIIAIALTAVAGAIFVVSIMFLCCCRRLGSQGGNSGFCKKKMNPSVTTSGEYPTDACEPLSMETGNVMTVRVSLLRPCSSCGAR